MKNALSKAKDVWSFWISKKIWKKVQGWQEVINAAECILKPLHNTSLVGQTEIIALENVNKGCNTVGEATRTQRESEKECMI